MTYFNYRAHSVAYTHKVASKDANSASHTDLPPLLLLHGWGPSKETFDGIIKNIGNSRDIYALDFPGFGDSDEPSTPWRLDDYTDMVIAFIEAMSLKTPIVIGHSFGGRVAIKLANRVTLDKVVLTSSAGIVPKRPLSYYTKIYGYKTMRLLNHLPLLHFILKEPVKAYSEKYSSSDYKMATPMMKRILSLVVNEDLTPLLKHIKVPTLLIWGDQDTATPIEDAKLMLAKIPDSGLVTFEGAGHFAYLEQPERFNTIIKSFIGE